MLAERLAFSKEFSGPWNFGPGIGNNKDVEYVAEKFSQVWGGEQSIIFSENQQSWKEATLLDLNCDLTEKQLGWKSVLGIDETIEWTANWYKSVYNENNAEKTREITYQQIKTYQDKQTRLC